MKRSLCSPPIRCLLMAIALLIIGSHSLLAEGSKDFRNYPGHRLFYNVEQKQQLKVYAKAGEFINVGSSHVGINAGFIEVYNPQGIRVAIFNGSDGTAIINNDVEELAGPTGGGSTIGTGYIPGIVEVTAGNEGVWSIRLGYPEPFRLAFISNLMNNDPWTRSADQPQGTINDQRVALAWDVTVSQNAAGNEGGSLLEGRLYSNEYISILDGNSREGNPRATSPTFFVLTKSGYLYQVDFDRMDPWGFPFHSNSLGLVNSDLTPTYQSAEDSTGTYIRSADPNSWVEGTKYLYDPQAEDFGPIINNKVFFNLPDTTMPTSALVTDIDPDRQNTHTTWLFNELPVIDGVAQPFTFAGFVPANSPCGQGLVAEQGAGGFFVFETNLAGQIALNLDINNNGSNDDPEDIVITKNVELGTDSLFWSGKDGLGNDIPANPNYTFSYSLVVRGGENHIMLLDVENIYGGVKITRVNGIESPDIQFYYDHTPVGGEASGGGTAGNPLPTTNAYLYDGNFGNKILLDHWAFIEANNFGGGTLSINIQEDCSVRDNDQDGIPDRIDIDDDNDGVPDLLEFCHPDEGWACLPNGLDPSADADDDRIPNFMDADDPAVNNTCTDVDADGVCDQILAIYDTDGDNVPDHFDLDSDNDGISDLVEAGHGQADADANGIIDGDSLAFGDNGLFNILETDDTETGMANYTPFDTDGDGIPDHDDLDSDQDGILDVVEAGYVAFDSDQDGRIDDGSGNVPMVDSTGLVPLINPAITGQGIPLPPDWDGDGVPDWHDLDSDQDGILDVIEAGHTPSDSDQDGRIDDGNGNIPTVNTDGLPPLIDPIITGQGVPLPPDWDGDSIPDWHDLDSDNDGILDVIEGGYQGSDTDLDGRIDENGNPPTVNADGLAPIMDPAITNSPINLPPDTDGDNVEDWHDLDSDNDGINGTIENLNPDGDNDGYIGTGPIIVDENGIAIADANGTLAPNTPLVNTDNEGPGDFRDLDSDGDTLTDVEEGGLSDPDGDGIIGTGMPVVNTNGQATEGTTSSPPDSDGNGTPDFQQIDCAIPPTPVLTTDNTDACIGETLVLTASGSAEIADTFRWTITRTDGSSEVLANTLDSTFTLSLLDSSDIGSYTVIAINDSCSSTISNSIVLNIIPIPSAPIITANNTDLCSGERLNLSITDGIIENASYQWTLTDTAGNSQIIDTTSDPNLIIANATSTNSGTYTVTTISENGNCASNPSNGIAITVKAKPQAPVLSVDNAIFCEGQALRFMATPVEGDNVMYIWIFTLPGSGRMDTLSIQASPEAEIANLVATNTGNYTVVALVDGCTSDPSNEIMIDVASGGLPNIIATSSAPAENPGCEGDNIVLSAPSLNGATYEWTGPNGFSATDSVVTIENAMIAANGSYTVTITINDCPKTLDPVTVQLNPIPSKPTLSTTATSICSGDGFTLNTDPVVGTDISYNWLLNGSLVISTNDPELMIISATTTDAGAYTVVVNQANCASDPSDPIDIMVREPLTGNITVEPMGGICEGETVTLSAPTAESATYEWTGPNGFTSTDSVVTIENATTDANGDYTVIVTLNDCPNTFGPLTLDINPKPIKPSITTDNATVCAGGIANLFTDLTPGDNISYDWLLNDAVIANTTMPNLEITDFQQANTGNYTVIVKDGDCASESSDPIEMMINDTLETAIASSNSPVCVGDTIQLMATEFEGATYVWTGPNGFTSMLSNPTIDSATTDHVGDYILNISLDGCTKTLPPVTIEITPMPDAPSIAISDTSICEGNMVLITITEPTTIPDGTTFTIVDAGGNVVASGTTDSISIPTEGSAGMNTYTVISQMNGACPSIPSNPVNLEVVARPNEMAMINDPGMGGECGEAPTSISAVIPTQGTGTWSSDNSDIIFTNPDSASTEISGLAEGDNIITWTLANELCGTYSSDQITITITTPEVTAANDNFTILNTESITNGNIIGNDSPVDGNITIITAPTNGTATLLGDALNYTPNASFVGTDEIVYELCSTICPNIPCQQATVTITVNQDPNNLDCTVPDVISPNNDNLNDVLEIPCSDFKNVNIKIFNRWGDQVYEATNYRNNWDGTTTDGDPLPPGPYYYIFEEDGAEPKTGCVSIAR